MSHHMMCHVSGGIFVDIVEGKDQPEEREGIQIPGRTMEQLGG